MDSGSVTPWADLPKELVEKIDSCPGSTQIDVLCLRSVCTTWRSAIPPFKNFPSLPLKLQVPIIPNDTDTFGSNPEFYLIDSTVYLIQPIDTNKPSSSSSRSGWLVKVMQTADGKLRVLNPLCHKAMDVTPEDVPNKSGDEKWTTLRDDSCKSILDIIVYKGNFYAVDLDGETIKFDYSLNETKVASRLHNMRVAVRRMKKNDLWNQVVNCFLLI
ncbi:F-box protein At2g17036-like [Solanum verrucosum]|uniref:F-box protein At2g17036-like n=1 Tax=Solanum verrucosum TaxID=315347 RepID=UPI0020D1E1D8|nr:F-box protein At2g17036-like [Solanum verrucosum]